MAAVTTKVHNDMQSIIEDNFLGQGFKEILEAAKSSDLAPCGKEKTKFYEVSMQQIRHFNNYYQITLEFNKYSEQW